MRRRNAPPPPMLPGRDGCQAKRTRRKLAESRPPPEDHISNLPDAVLGEIISLLPTKDGARSQILASRWRHLWCSAPLNLDCCGLVKRGDDIVSRILSSHQGPGRRFLVPEYFLYSPSATVDAWLRSPALDNLQELEYFYSEEPPPASVFRFSPTLRAVTLGSCRLPDTVRGLHFPLLKQLGLEEVGISECSLQSLIDGCPALESLLIYHCFGFRRVCISSLTIRSIGVDSYDLQRRRNDAWTPQLQELIIDGAPRLERLLLLDLEMGLHISVATAPKLQTIGFLSDGYYECNQDHLLCRLVFGPTVIQGPRVDSLAMALHTVKILALRMRTLCLDTAIKLLTCFPCLEKLYIKEMTLHQQPRAPNNFWRRKHRNLIECLDIRLKTVVLKYYCGAKSEVNFVTFFVLNARMLELMTLQIATVHYNEEFLAKERTKLQLENRASRAAQFHFTTDRCIRTSRDINHVHDLDVVDPFKAPC